MADAHPPRAEAEPAKAPRRRVPTAVLVSILGIALSAWLLPAVTRQWDDRQKERELKAQIIAQMASSTAKAVVAGEAFWFAQSPNTAGHADRTARVHKHR